MRIDRRTVLAALMAAGLCAAGSAIAASPDPTGPIRLLEGALNGHGGRVPTEGEVRAAAEQAFDFDTMARAVLGNQAASARQFARFRDALAGRIVLDMLERRRKDGTGTASFVRTRPGAAGEWLVETRIVAGDSRQRSATWRVHDGTRGPLIIDATSAGASLVGTLRNAHRQALPRYGLDGVIERMEARNRRVRG